MSPSTSGSLGEVEDFYHLQLGRELYSLIEQTPLEQLVVLAERIERRTRIVQLQLRLNRYKGERSPTLHERLFLEADDRSSVIQLAELKSWILYGIDLLVADPGMDWAIEFLYDHRLGLLQEANTAREQTLLVNALKRLMEARPAIMSGVVRMVPSRRQYAYGPDVDDASPLQFLWDSHLELGNLYWQDPLLADRVVRKLAPMSKWLQRNRGLDDPRDVQDLASEIVLEKLETDRGVIQRWDQQVMATLYGTPATSDQFEDALLTSSMLRDARLPTAGLAPTSYQHLIRTSRVTLDPGSLSRTRGRSSSAVGRVIEMRLPELSGIPLGDVVNMRLDGDVYSILGPALREFTTLVSALQPGSFAAMQQEVLSIADDVLAGPQHALAVRSKKIRTKRWAGGLAAGTGTGLIVNGIAMLVPPLAAIPIRAVGNVVSNVLAGRARQVRAATARDLQVATSVVMSLRGQADA